MLGRILVSAAILVGSAVAADSPTRAVTYTLADDSVPFVDHGYLIDLKHYLNAPPDGLTVFDRTGRLLYQTDVTAPDGSPGHLHARTEAVAADADGNLLLPMSYGGYGGNGHMKGAGVVVLDRDGKQVRFVDTARFLPDAACFGPDHSIWVIGTQFTPIREGDPIDHVSHADYNLVRKYSPEGKLMGSFLPRSLFPPGLPPGEVGWMRASRDRIGVMTYPGTIANNPEWIELDLEGKLLGRWKLGPQRTADPATHNSVRSLEGFALTADNRLFAHVLTCPAPHECTSRLEFLDFATSAWKEMGDDPIDRFHLLVGADGDDVVLWDRSPVSGGGVHLVWIKPDQMH